MDPLHRQSPGVDLHNPDPAIPAAANSGPDSAADLAAPLDAESESAEPFEADSATIEKILQVTGVFVAEMRVHGSRIDAAVPAVVAAAGFDWPGRSYDAVMFWSAIGTRISWSKPSDVESRFQVLLSNQAFSVRLVRAAPDRWAAIWQVSGNEFSAGSDGYSSGPTGPNRLASVLTDLSGRIAWWNEQFLQFAAVSEVQQGATVQSILPNDMGPSIGEVLKGAAAGETIDELIATVQPEPRWFRVHANHAAAADSTSAAASLVVFHFEEITSSPHARQGLVDQIVRDPLTGLYNRRALLDIAELDDPAQSPFTAVLLADVRRFKSINDLWGQGGGDECLIEVARWLRSVARPTDVVVRLSGNEFLVLCVAGSPVPQAVENAGDIEVPFGEDRIVITLQAGWDRRFKGQDLLSVVDHAERALAAAKRSSWRTVVRWTPEISRAASERVDEEERVRRAVVAGEIEVYFQPLIDVERGVVQSAEALLRLGGPGAGLDAERIIEASHVLGLTPRLAKMFCQRAFADGRKLRGVFGGASISVNISREFMGTGLAIGTVAEAAAEAGLEPADIVLELTEEVAVGVSSAVLMAELRRGAELGLAIVIDDFGRGETALSMLRSLPLAAIKLDRSLLPTDGDAKGWEFVQGTASLLRTLAPRLVAEGVETVTQSRRLLEMGISIQQGYLFGRAMPTAYWLDHEPVIPAR
ncbi:EAL domain-containing protein [Jatrophihabitans sp. DSM 45814]